MPFVLVSLREAGKLVYVLKNKRMRNFLPVFYDEIRVPTNLKRPCKRTCQGKCKPILDRNKKNAKIKKGIKKNVIF